MYICNRCCPTERYIKTVRIPGDLCLDQEEVELMLVNNHALLPRNYTSINTLMAAGNTYY